MDKKEFYKNVPSPLGEERFNAFLRENNVVVEEWGNWIVIKNKFIDNQLVAFYKYIDVDYKDIGEIHKKYPDKHIYRNSDNDRSVKDRFHLHIKL